MYFSLISTPRNGILLISDWIFRYTLLVQILTPVCLYDNRHFFLSRIQLCSKSTLSNIVSIILLCHFLILLDRLSTRIKLESPLPSHRERSSMWLTFSYRGGHFYTLNWLLCSMIFILWHSVSSLLKVATWGWVHDSHKLKHVVSHNNEVICSK